MHAQIGKAMGLFTADRMSRDHCRAAVIPARASTETWYWCYFRHLHWEPRALGRVTHVHTQIGEQKTGRRKSVSPNLHAVLLDQPSLLEVYLQRSRAQEPLRAGAVPKIAYRGGTAFSPGMLVVSL